MGSSTVLPRPPRPSAPCPRGDGAQRTPTCAGISRGAAGGERPLLFTRGCGCWAGCGRAASLPAGLSASDKAKGEREEAGNYKAEGGKKGGGKRHRRCLRSHPPPPSPIPAAGARPGARETEPGSAGNVPWAGAGLASVLGILGLLSVNSFSSLQSSLFT